MHASEYCINHDPDQEGARARRASKGGKTGGRGRGYKTTGELGDLKVQLKDLAAGVLDGTTDRGRAAVANQILNTLIRAVEQERKITEQDEILTRLEALEDRYNEHGGSRQQWRV